MNQGELTQEQFEDLREDVVIIWGLSEDEGTRNLRQQQNNNPINMEDIVNETSRDVGRCIYRMFRGEGTRYHENGIPQRFPNFRQMVERAQTGGELTVDNIIDNISEEYKQFLENNINQLPGIFTIGERYIFNNWRELMGYRRRYFIQATHAGPQAGNTRSKKRNAKGKKARGRKTPRTRRPRRKTPRTRRPVRRTRRRRRGRRI